MIDSAMWRLGSTRREIPPSQRVFSQTLRVTGTLEGTDSNRGFRSHPEGTTRIRGVLAALSTKSSLWGVEVTGVRPRGQLPE